MTALVRSNDWLKSVIQKDEMKSEFVKCWSGNLDGQREGLVIAHNQKEAMSVIKTGPTDFRNYWSLRRADDWPRQNVKPMTLYTRPYMSGEPFQEGRCKVKR